MQLWSKLLVAFVVLLPSVASSSAATTKYEIAATLLHEGVSFATPSAVVVADTPGSIEVSGPDGYKLTLTVTDLGPDQIKVAATVDSSHGSMAPTVVVRPGQAASVSVDNLGLELTVRRSDG